MTSSSASSSPPGVDPCAPVQPLPHDQWPRVLAQLISGSDLHAAQAGAAMSAIMAGEVSPARIAGFLVALRAKGETVAEMAGLSRAMLALATPLRIAGPCVDIVGTGGDRANTVNISTMAAVVMAGAGAQVVKHGNRAASSQCGSADVLEELGVDLEASAQKVQACAQQVGITFCFAPRFHPAMRHVAPTRRDLGVPTAFNFLGPLTNPARVQHSAIGVADERMAGLLAGVLADQGSQALLFRGEDGLDELTTSTASQVWVVLGGQVSTMKIDPQVLGIKRSQPGDLTGADRQFNARVFHQVLNAQMGPIRDAVVLNAAAGLASLQLDAHFQAGHPCGDRQLLEVLDEGLSQAQQAIDSGAARQVLAKWIGFHA